MDLDTGLAPGHAQHAPTDTALMPQPPKQHTEGACDSAPVSIAELQRPPMPAEPPDDSSASLTTPGTRGLPPPPPAPMCPSTCASWEEVRAALPTDDAAPSQSTPHVWLASPWQSQPEAEYSPSPVGPPKDKRCVQENVLWPHLAQFLYDAGRVEKPSPEWSSEPRRVPFEPGMSDASPCLDGPRP